MTPHAPLRLADMLSRHALTPPGAFNGGALMRELIALEGTLGIHEDTRDHDREVERLRDESLADGCAASDFTNKIEMLMRHQPHLERKLEGVELCKFIVRLMPAANAAEGRNIIRRRVAAGTMNDRLGVLKECTIIVRESQAPAARIAAAATPANAAAAVQAAVQPLVKRIEALSRKVESVPKSGAALSTDTSKSKS